MEFCTYLGKASKQYVFLVSGKATLNPDIKGEWRITAAHSYRDARSTVGTVPILCPYRMMFSGLTPYLQGESKADQICALFFKKVIYSFFLKKTTQFFRYKIFRKKINIFLDIRYILTYWQILGWFCTVLGIYYWYGFL